jgi:hypothetical protein
VQNAETFEGWRWCTDPVCIRGGSQGQAAAPQMVAVGSNTYSITDSSAATGTSNVTAGTNYNVRVEASPGVAGNVIATRQFKAAKGAKAVTVRYRIATSEIFAPTPMADSYAVTLQVGSSTTSDSGNVLQLSYTSSAATVWKTLTMAVAENDPITVTARVANVGDTTWPSLVEVDQISETVYSTSGELTQVIAYTRNGARLERSEPLRYLSAAPHGYGPTPGYTTISGTLTVSGPSDDRLAAISLRISRGPVFLEPLLVGTASLDAAAGQALLNRALNAGVTYTGQLFSIDSSIFALLTSDKVALQVKATTTQGRTLVLIASKPVFAWHKFPNQSGPSRYGARDVRGCLARVNGVVTETIFPCNGDDWAFPGVITLASQLQSQGISVDDFSHMNGGSWRPHASHQIGVDVDAYFPRYELRNQAAVDKLVSLLGSSLGPKIARIFVTFTPGFSAMLENVPTLPNGVQPKRVIRNVPFHGGHFHIRFASPQ